MLRILFAFALVFILALGFSGTADASWNSAAHWVYWPGYASLGWSQECGKYSIYDNGTSGEPASCYYHAAVCVNHVQTEYIDVHQNDGDIWFNRGPATGPAC